MDATLSYPPHCTYAVAQLDVQATVENLDSNAQEAARTIKPAQCLVYLYEIIEYPSTNKPWTRFGAWIVGPGLRAEDSRYCLTRDMCTPILPNTTHPDGRPPVHTDPTFPLADCCHWAYTDVLLRVPANGKFPSRDDPYIIKMAPGEMIRVDELMTEDLTAAVLAKRQREASMPHGQLDYDSADDAFVLKTKVPDELVPVVTVSLDLAGMLDEHSLPDPVEFLSERDALVRIVRHSNTWKKFLEERPPSDDDFASISRVSIAFSDETVLSDEDRYETVPRVKGILRLSQAIRRILGKAESRDWKEYDTSRRFFDEDSEVDVADPFPKQSKALPSLRKIFGSACSFLRSRSTSPKHNQ